MIYLRLLWAFFQIGLFSIGGGYAALPLIQEQVVDTNGWLNMAEFADVITISQMTPGPIAINSATFVGTKIAGIPGAIIATLGCILPAGVIVVILAVLYRKYKKLAIVQGMLSGLRPAVVGMIAAAGHSIINHALWEGGDVFVISSIDFIALILIVVCIFALRKKLNPILVMLGAGAAGGLLYSIF